MIPKRKPRTALVWLRRDLRLSDSPALLHALGAAERVVPVYVWAPEEEAPWAPGAASRWWLHHSLESLDGALRQAGSRLVIRRGPSAEALRRLAREAGASLVAWNGLPEPAAGERDAAVTQALREAGLEVAAFPVAELHQPALVRTGGGKPYRVFTPFWRALRAQGFPEPLPAPDALPPVSALASEAPPALGLLPAVPWDRGFGACWRPGEAGALAALDRFCEQARAGYGRGRDIPGEVGTSRLSPHLHFGEITPRQCAARLLRDEARGAGAGAERFLVELGWREFGRHLLFHFPHTAAAPLDTRFERFPWRRGYARELARWQRGRTGFPIVDAGMRELWSTGWMHNRVRMIVASFLTKNLLVPWQEGAQWFWDTLVDADLASNTLGWQWTAGCGADAAPYFRIFNPVLQSRRFDPGGTYLRRWLPELAALPADALHLPPPALGEQAGYPAPMVDLAATRRRALEAYARIRAAR